MQRFADRGVLVTGAASGIGRATVHRLVDEGARVVAVDRVADGLEATARSAADPGRIQTHVADLTDPQARSEAVQAAIDHLGGIDALANVAGVHRTTPLDEVTEDELAEVHRINCIAPVLVCQQAAPHMRSGGAILNVASTAATKAHPYMVAYAASKGALLAATITLAAELAPRGIRVVALSPGGVDTPLTRAPGIIPEGRDASFFARVTPIMGGRGQPEDLAAAIAFALSDDGRYVNGVELRVDGGSYV